MDWDGWTRHEHYLGRDDGRYTIVRAIHHETHARTYHAWHKPAPTLMATWLGSAASALAALDIVTAHSAERAGQS